MNSLRSILVVLGLLAASYGLVCASSAASDNNKAALATTTAAPRHVKNPTQMEAVKVTPAETEKDKKIEKLGDAGSLIRRVRDLDTAAGEHGKYILVKKKPKHKKIKMEVFEPKMKYKKIKMKIPVKKMKKKKVKGYLVKKEKEHSYM